MLHKMNLTCLKCLTVQNIPLKSGYIQDQATRCFSFTHGVEYSLNDPYLTIQMHSVICHHSKPSVPSLASFFTVMPRTSSMVGVSVPLGIFLLHAMLWTSCNVGHSFFVVWSTKRKAYEIVKWTTYFKEVTMGWIVKAHYSRLLTVIKRKTLLVWASISFFWNVTLVLKLYSSYETFLFGHFGY